LTLRSQLFAAGAALFIQKPFTPVQLQIMLHLLVTKAAASRNANTSPQKDLALVA
jgi:DNA-binding response OmpR family regulator